MKKTLVLAASLLAPACNLFYDRDSLERPPEASELRRQGDEALAQGSLGAALAYYDRTLKADPADTHAATGAALMQTLLLPSAAPVTDLLDACGQTRFDVEKLFFGAEGLLARDELDRGGAGDLKVFAREPPQGFGDVGFQADHFRSSLEHRDDSSGVRNELSIRLTDARMGDQQYPASVYLTLDVDDLYGDDGATMTPLTDGRVIDVARLRSGSVDFYSDKRWLFGTRTGTMTFRGGTRVGDTFSLELDVATGGCFAPVDNELATCTQETKLTGSLQDSVSAPFALRDEDVPFGTLTFQAGPPQVDWFVQAVERCGAGLTTDFLAQKAKALVPHLESIIGRLDAALAPSGRVSFTLPKTLLHTDEDLVLSRTDLLALRGAAHLAAAALELGAAYRYLDGPLVSLIGTREACVGTNTVCDTTCEIVPVVAQVRDFLAGTVANNLAATLLTRAAGFDLARARGHLESALSDAAAALRNRAGSPQGILDFQAPNAGVFSSQLAELVDAVRASLQSATPIALPRDPLYQIHLKSFFDAPLDRDRLLQLTGKSALARVEAGDPSADYCSEYNDALIVEQPESLVQLQTWGGGMFFAPADLSATACGPTAPCPAGYTCSDATLGGYCDAGPELQLTEQAPWDAAFEADLPAFFLPGVRRLFDTWD